MSKAELKNAARLTMHSAAKSDFERPPTAAKFEPTLITKNKPINPITKNADRAFRRSFDPAVIRLSQIRLSSATCMLKFRGVDLFLDRLSVLDVIASRCAR